MDKILIFIIIAASITLATEEIKKVWNMIKRIKVAIKNKTSVLNEIKIGLLVAQALGVWAIFSFGIGLISIMGIEYPNESFRLFDLFATAFIVSGGAGIINKWQEIIANSNKK